MKRTRQVHRILVPVDFGRASAHAVSIAVAIARELGAQVRVLHVETLDAPPYFTHDQVKALEAQRANARRAALRFLVAFAERNGARSAEATVADGSPAEVILRHASRADAIVMGTNDRGVAARLWMGSVAERVRRESPVPVLVTRASDPIEPAKYLALLDAEWTRRSTGETTHG